MQMCFPFLVKDMTLQEAIDRVNHLKPNQYTVPDMIKWISELDGRVYHEILSHFANAPEWEPYTENTNTSIQLLVPEPYSNIYEYYLSAMIDRWNGEYDRYNNEIDQFNEVFIAFGNRYRKTHLTNGVTRFRY